MFRDGGQFVCRRCGSWTTAVLAVLSVVDDVTDEDDRDGWADDETLSLIPLGVVA
ncbi:hypothetical protein ABZ820_12730 [Streptomyces diacarni]|uniref:hypothetical protein n=1 Tax=Streptomyces diacarni TaxID=2800381 RepID=UPI0034087516